MSKENSKPDYSFLENSLTKKGAIKDSKPIAHKELLKNSELFHSLSSSEHSHLKYLRYKEAVKETYQETKDWEKVINTVIYEDTQEGNEPFIDYIEELYNIRVKDAKHLSSLTGIKDETELEDIILKAKICRYETALETALKNGAKYKDLLQIKPKEYGLPEKWKTWREGDQYSSILWALGSEFMINEPAGLAMLPDLRSIAQELEAPYLSLIHI